MTNRLPLPHALSARPQQQEVVAAFILPTQGKRLIVPNVAIAEIIAMTPIQPLEQAPPSCQGLIHWRGIDIPVLSFEQANSQMATHTTTQSRIAVFNSINPNSALAFFAILIQAIPRMLKVGKQDLTELDDPCLVAESMLVQSQNIGQLVIPNLAYLHSLAERCMQPVTG